MSNLLNISYVNIIFVCIYFFYSAEADDKGSSIVLDVGWDKTILNSGKKHSDIVLSDGWGKTIISNGKKRSGIVMSDIWGKTVVSSDKKHSNIILSDKNYHGCSDNYRGWVHLPISYLSQGEKYSNIISGDGGVIAGYGGIISEGTEPSVVSGW